ncbi:MAG: class I SAM-dependent methyltransferase [Ferruginibacter sp.]
MNFENFYTTGDYLSKNHEWGAEDSVWKGMLVAKLLDKNNISFNTMAELGCGARGILQYLHTNYNGKYFYGYDISPQSIAIAKQKYSDIKELHFIHLDYLNETHQETDILLMLDVIEHVADYYDFLNKIHPKSNLFILPNRK